MSKYLLIFSALFLFGRIYGADGHDHDKDHAGGDHAGHDHASEHKDEKPPHGGILREVGDDHLELVIESATGALTLYVLTGELKPHAIAETSVSAQVKLPGATSLQAVTLTAKPQDGEAKGSASRFTAEDATLKDKAPSEVIVRVPLDGKSQRVVFSTARSKESEGE